MLLQHGYTFAGWSISPGATIGSYTAGSMYTDTTSRTLYAIWTVNTYYLDLNGLLDGTSPGNISGYGTADVYVNGSLVAAGVTEYCQAIPYGSTYEIKNIQATTGHTYNGVHSGSISGTMGTSAISVVLNFTTNTYYLDLNGLLDGTSPGNISGYGTADVYVNGSIVATGVSDFYQQIAYGSTYEIKNIQVTTGHTYNGVHSGSISGTMGASAISVVLNFTTNTYYLDLNGLLDGTGSGNISGYGTVDVYVNGSKVATGVTDFYQQITYGSTYEIKNIKATTGHTYNGVHSGSISGTMGTSAIGVVLSFTTNTYYLDKTVTQAGGYDGSSGGSQKFNVDVTGAKTLTFSLSWYGWGEYEMAFSIKQNNNTLCDLWQHTIIREGLAWSYSFQELGANPATVTVDVSGYTGEVTFNMYSWSGYTAGEACSFTISDITLYY